MLKKFPLLNSLMCELNELAAEERLRLAEESRRVANAGGLYAVRWAGREYLATPPQVDALRLLIEAAAGARPDVDQFAIVRAAGRTRGKVAEVFAGLDGWESLVVPGRKVGTYRLAELHGADDEGASDEGGAVHADAPLAVRERGV